MPKKKVRYDPTYPFLALAIVIIIALSLLQIQNYSEATNEAKSVLSYQTSDETLEDYWTDFLETEADYLPGWVELAEIQLERGNLEGFQNSLEEIKRLNPNYPLPF